MNPEKVLRGTKNGRAKLTEEKVKEIIAALKMKVPHRALAAKYSVSRGLIGFIASGRHWAHIPRD
jgi:hypothetical protein